MKQMLCIVLALILVAAMPGCAAGMQEQNGEATPSESCPIIVETLDPENHPAIPTTQPLPVQTIKMDAVGGTRVNHTANVSSVRYITSADQLPDEAMLTQYDDVYFRSKALVLVLETVGSGSVRVGIESITIDANVALVTLTHELQGEADLPTVCTWMVWAEVEKDLDYRWQVTNPAMHDGTEKS